MSLTQSSMERASNGKVDALATFAATINREHELVQQAGMEMIEHAILAGEALLAAKQEVPRGHWEAWLAENVAQKSRVALQTYMRMARHAGIVRNGQPTTIKGAQRLLAGATDSRVDEGMVAEARRLRRQEKASTPAIAATLGVSQSTAWNWVNPGKRKRHQEAERKRTMAGRRALTRKQRDAAVRKGGGHTAKAYAFVRRALGELEQALEATADREAKRSVQDGMNRLYGAEDAIVRASKGGAL